MTEHLNKNDRYDNLTGKCMRRTAGAFFLALAVLLLSSCQGTESLTAPSVGTVSVTEEELALGDIPEYSGDPYVEVEDSEPDFTEEELTEEPYESYSELDGLGRCQEAQACVGKETMPEGERESISEVKPTGWQSVEYEEVDGRYLYNRCHLIGYQLTAENANEKNLITGTRYMNTEGMLPFEDEVADYVKETGNHVMYRVTPVFEGENLVASGVWMEAESVEDNGQGVSFNVYVYNVQPGIEIDYAQGDSWEAADDGQSRSGSEDSQPEDAGEENAYILNKNTRRFHKPDCSSVEDIKEENKGEFRGDRQELLDDGYKPCGRCNP
nr:DNA/RNA non-specific endonuclease [Claveliimonas monacensis]